MIEGENWCLNGRAGSSPETAMRLEKAIGKTSGTRLRTQMTYDLAQGQRTTGRLKITKLEAAD